MAFQKEESVQRKQTVAPKRDSKAANDLTGFEDLGSKITRRNTMAYDIGVKAKKDTRGQFEKRGWILKKATSTYMGMANWQRRYLRLDNGKLYMYDGDKPKDMLKSKKMIDMQNVKCVCFHYDPQAPMKSQKLNRADKNDKSRFDIYTPGRIFHLKSENEDTFNSDEWLAVLQKCAAHYNEKYDTKFL